MVTRKRTNHPPKLASALLALVTSPSDRAFLMGDLAEEFHDVAMERGEDGASRWYWSQALRSVGPLFLSRLTSEQRTRSVGGAAVGAVTAIASATAFGLLLNLFLGFRPEASLGLIAVVVTSCALVSSTCAAWASTWVSGEPSRWAFVLIGLVVVAPDFVYAARSHTVHMLPGALLPLSLAIVATCAGLALGGKLCRSPQLHS